MKTTASRFSLWLALFFCCVRLPAQAPVEIANVRAALVNGTTAISLSLKNRTSVELGAHIDLEWLSPKGLADGTSRRDLTLALDDSVISVVHPLCDRCDPLTERLQYSVAPTRSNLTAFAPVSGIVSLPNIADYAFAINVITVGNSIPKQPFEVRTAATHPLTGQPVKGVKITSHGVTAITGPDGLALLKVVRDEEDGTPIQISGVIGDYRAKAESDWREEARENIRVYTDKPIYQPGQTMHLRLLLLHANRRAARDRELDLRVTDGAGEVQFSTHVKTSEFGIAAADWDIPPNATPGSYEVECQTDRENAQALLNIEVKAYELPSFRVDAKSERSFYLLGEKASIDIRGEYLFGKPLDHADVKVIASDRNGETIAQGPLDSRGLFHATFNVKTKLEEESKFEDFHYIAFVTDLSTNRTEQREFDIRMSRDPIHIYAIRMEPGSVGWHLYVSTYSPDGVPVASDVEVLQGGSTLGRGKTNRFGLGRIDLTSLTTSDDAPTLSLRAVTATGLRASAPYKPADSKNGDQSSELWFTINRSLYREGETVKCRIGAGTPDQSVIVVAFNEENQTVFEKSLKLNKGHAQVTIPYVKSFGRVLNIAVATTQGRLTATRRAYFPGTANLQLKATAARTNYRPGDTATIRFESSARAALGIAIVDQSVLERARTDQAFGPRPFFAGSDPDEPNFAGVTENDLLSLQPSKIDDPDLQLLAEVFSVGHMAFFDRAPDPLREIGNTFEREIATNLRPVLDAIDEHYMQTLDFPNDENSLQRIAGSEISQVLDPWRQPLHPTFSVEGPDSVVRLVSNGPDKQRATDDDIVGMTLRRKWFSPEEKLIRDALRKASGYPTSLEEFARTLQNAGLRLEAFRDPWGTPLRAEVTYSLQFRVFRLISAGPDRKFSSPDDVTVAKFESQYFDESETAIDQVLEKSSNFPSTGDEFRMVLSDSGIDFDALRDPFGRPYYISFREEESFVDQIEMFTYAEYAHAPEQRRATTPVKQTARVAEIRSAGEDGVKGSYDDFAVATFRRVLREHEPSVIQEKPQIASTILRGRGTIAGTVFDSSGAVLPGTQLILNDLYFTSSDQEGRFVFRGLPSGKYRVTCSSRGFERSVLEAIPVADGHVTRLHFTLQIGSVTEMVVQAEAKRVEADVAQSSSAANSSTTAFTPRVREYFPETLFWQPELLTDSTGHASIRVKLADSVTTWHVAVIGSTLDGHIAEEGLDIRAFQPFLVDLDVPPTLTAGDQVSVPVPIRNYLERAQSVAVTAQTPDALKLLGSVPQLGPVAASSAGVTTLDLEAVTTATKALVRVTAIGGSDSDAIERPVRIHPDGERRTAAIGSVVTSTETLNFPVAPNAVKDSIEGQVRIYPSLLARILEAANALLQTPHGCAEQTISLAYPNLLTLKALNRVSTTETKITARAMKNLSAGYGLLLKYENAQGGFTYWGRGASDVALTSYALTFLLDAKTLIPVDEDLLSRTREWLSKHITNEQASSALRLEALAHAQIESPANLERQLGEMARRAVEYDDPYALAAFASAAMAANSPDLAATAIDRLCRTAQDERGAAWWNLRANTPFHGWGRWGQVETTAMAVTALTHWRKLGHEDVALNKLISRGTLFLLRNTTENGAWATSQSTARALLALVETNAGNRTGPVEIEVRVNGTSAGKVKALGNRTTTEVLNLDVSRLLHPGDNQISFGGLQDGAAEVQTSAAWYEPWATKRPDKDLDMQVQYGTVNAAINQQVPCNVVISRPAFAGYGMMIANVGLPPGSEVDRGALEAIVGQRKLGVDSYEVAPDHVSFYMWPRAADTKFQFFFRPRFAMKARAAQSMLYDFYNPDSHVTLAPATFIVHR